MLLFPSGAQGRRHLRKLTNCGELLAAAGRQPARQTGRYTDTRRQQLLNFRMPFESNQGGDGIETRELEASDDDDDDCDDN